MPRRRWCWTVRGTWWRRGTTGFDGFKSVYATTFDGASWTTATPLGGGLISGTPTVAPIAGQTTVMWSENIGGPDGPSELRLHQSVLTGSVWSTPTQLSIIDEPDSTPDTERRLAWLDEAPADAGEETVVSYFVEAPDAGDFNMPTEALMRVNEAAGVWNATDLGVTLTQVLVPTAADIYFRFDDTSVLGGVEEGILAVSEYASFPQSAGAYPDGNELQPPGVQHRRVWRNGRDHADYRLGLAHGRERHGSG